MARNKGKGQQFDHLWRTLNELFNDYWNTEKNNEEKIIVLIQNIKQKEPTSDYEKHDKNNLLNQAYELLKRNYLRKLEQ